jgi:hypothetical protein
MTEQARLAAADRSMAGTPLPDHVPDFLPDGVYFGMDEDDYHNSPALGSTDIKRLAQSPPDFWFQGKHNPDWEPDEPTPAKKFGKAAHKCVLEGHDAFRALYAPVHEPGNTRDGKEERAATLATGRDWLLFEDFRRIEYMGAMVRSNPSLANAFVNGVGSEVSIFWTDARGMRKKCRIDYLKQRATVDFKTVGNQYNKHFPIACRDAISNYRYDIQAAHYHEGRAQLKRLVKTGATQGAGPALDKLAQAAAQESWAWVFVFCQSSGAPLTFGCSLSAGADGANPILEIGRRSIEIAEHNWDIYCKRFGGLGSPWVLDEPLAELSIDDFSNLAFK